MKVLLCGDLDAAGWHDWRAALHAASPQVQWLDLDAARAESPAIEVAVVANPAPGSLVGFDRLRLIQSLWAGVDRLLADSTLPAGVPIVRMVDPALGAAMAETVLWAVLSLHRGFFVYACQQRAELWQVHAQRRADELRVTVLGLGQMGRAAAQRLAQQGYRVDAVGAGLRSAAVDATAKAGFACHGGAAALERLLPVTDIVVNLLPLTPSTSGIIDARFLAALPRGAAVVNLARGAHVVDVALLAALDSGQIGHAVLDVFQTEPLPASHPYWRHPRVTLLPHAAALTDPRSAAQVVADNLAAWAAGRPLRHVVERERGY